MNDKNSPNIYNRNSFLLSGYGDLYCFGSSIKGVSPNIARSTGTRIGTLLDMNAGTVAYWVDNQRVPHVVQHACLTEGEWYITVTFGSGAAGAKFVLEPPPPLRPDGVANGLRVAVVGASLGGLSVANVLHRNGALVSVFEVSPLGFHNRGGALGSVNVKLVAEIPQRDQRHLSTIQGHGHFYGDLWKHLYEELPEGTVTFGCDVRR